MTFVFQAISTKYLAPTDTKGSRIKATTGSGGASITIDKDDSLSDEKSHLKAIEALLEKMGWDKERMAIGGTKEGYVAVPVPYPHNFHNFKKPLKG